MSDEKLERVTSDWLWLLPSFLRFEPALKPLHCLRVTTAESDASLSFQQLRPWAQMDTADLKVRCRFLHHTEKFLTRAICKSMRTLFI